MGNAVKNWRTTVLGWASAVAYYLSTNGGKLPQTKLEWANLVVAVLFGGLGTVAQDAPKVTP